MLVMAYIVISFKVLTEQSRIIKSAQLKLATINRTKMGFDHIFVINVNEERRIRTKRMLDYHNIDHEMWKAETPESHIVRTYLKIKNDDDINWKPITACYASHLAVYQEIIRKEYRNALILEDDIDMEMDVVDRMERLMKSIRGAEWDILFPGHCYSGDFKPSKYKGWSTADMVHCTHAYAISNGFAAKILAENTAPPMPIDLVQREYCSHGKCKRYVLKPVLFAQLPKTLVTSLLNLKNPIKATAKHKFELKNSTFLYLNATKLN